MTDVSAAREILFTVVFPVLFWSTIVASIAKLFNRIESIDILYCLCAGIVAHYVGLDTTGMTRIYRGLGIALLAVIVLIILNTISFASRESEEKGETQGKRKVG